MCFLNVEYNRVGADTHITPREIIRDFIELLDILLQNPDKTMTGILNDGGFVPSQGAEKEDAFTEFEV